MYLHLAKSLLISLGYFFPFPLDAFFLVFNWEDLNYKLNPQDLMTIYKTKKSVNSLKHSPAVFEANYISLYLATL